MEPSGEDLREALEGSLELLPTVVLNLEQCIKDALEEENQASLKALMATVHETHVAFDQMCAFVQARMATKAGEQ